MTKHKKHNLKEHRIWKLFTLPRFSGWKKIVEMPCYLMTHIHIFLSLTHSVSSLYWYIYISCTISLLIIC